MNDIIIYIVIWLSSYQGIPIEEIPVIVEEDAKILSLRFGAPVYALYQRSNKTIYMADELDMEDIFSKSVLVHEIIHHYQNESGLMSTYRCVLQAEELAYFIQRDFLVDHGEDIDDYPILGEFNILMRSACVD